MDVFKVIARQQLGQSSAGSDGLHKDRLSPN